MALNRRTKYSLPDQLVPLLPVIEALAPLTLKTAGVGEMERNLSNSELGIEITALIKKMRAELTPELEICFWDWAQNETPKRPSERNSIQVILDTLRLERLLNSSAISSDQHETMDKQSGESLCTIKIPQNLKYLFELANRYQLTCEADIDAALKNISSTELTMLQHFANKVRINNHYERVLELIKEYPLPRYPESCWLYFLFGLLDSLEISFEF